MQERKQFIEDWLAGGRCDPAGLGRTYGICRKTGHKWVQRFLAAGQPSRTNHTRAPTARGAIRRRWTFVSSVHRPAGIQAALESARVSPIRSVYQTRFCPRPSNPACGFPALGSRSKSCIRPRKPDRPTPQARELHGLPQALVRAAHEFPDFAFCFRHSHRRRCLLVCASPPLRSASARLPTGGAKDWNELLRHSRIPSPPPTALR